ncbi:MAG TPA: hypothetical protein VFW71_02675 [Actinomycetota bacterium]|nr:hypothetical protein [Actinomycetota bacterium]
MNLTLVAVIEVALLAAGAVAAARLVQRVGTGERKVVLLVAASIWLVAFGLVPFFAFALLAPGGHAGQAGAGTFENGVLNAVPFVLVASPLLGVLHGLRITGRRPRT